MLPIDIAMCMISQADLTGFYVYHVLVEHHVHILMACGQCMYVHVYMYEPQSVSILLLQQWQGTECQSVVSLLGNDAAGCYNIIYICYFHTLTV
jgi:hypothetical protein